MTGAHQQGRPDGRLVAAVAVVVAATVALVAEACMNLADQHWRTGVFALLLAAGFSAALVVIRALFRLNGVLINQNARLLHAAGEDTLIFAAQRQDRPGPRRRRGPSRADRQIALARLQEALGRAEEGRSEDEDAG